MANRWETLKSIVEENTNKTSELGAVVFKVHQALNRSLTWEEIRFVAKIFRHWQHVLVTDY